MDVFANPTQSSLNALILSEPFGLLPSLQRAVPQVGNWSDIQIRKQTNSGYINFTVDNTNPSLMGSFTDSPDEVTTMVQFGFGLLVSPVQFNNDPLAFVRTQLLAADYRREMVQLAHRFRSSNRDRSLADLEREVKATDSVGGVRGMTILSQGQAETTESGSHFLTVRVAFLLKYIEGAAPEQLPGIAMGVAPEGMLPGSV